MFLQDLIIRFMSKMKTWSDEHDWFSPLLFIIIVLFIAVMISWTAISSTEGNHKCHFCGLYSSKFHGSWIEYDGKKVWCCDKQLDSVIENNVNEYNRRINETHTTQPSDKYKASR
jgi:hypothetical protein